MKRKVEKTVGVYERPDPGTDAGRRFPPVVLLVIALLVIALLLIAF